MGNLSTGLGLTVVAALTLRGLQVLKVLINWMHGMENWVSYHWNKQTTISYVLNLIGIY